MVSASELGWGLDRIIEVADSGVNDAPMWPEGK